MTAFIAVGFYDMRPLFRQRRTNRTAEFRLRRPENRLLVKGEGDGSVLICATADNLSVEQQTAFVRYLGEEGFMSGAWFEATDRPVEWSSDHEGRPVRWVIDPAWPEPDPVYARHLQRLCWYATGTMMVWLALLAVLVCC